MAIGLTKMKEKLIAAMLIGLKRCRQRRNSFIFGSGDNLWG